METDGMDTGLPRGRGCLILAHGRQELLNQTIEAIRHQVDTVMVIDNASEPPLEIPEGVGSMFIPDQPPSISRFWNIGLNFFAEWYQHQGYGQNYDVAVLCDDAPPPVDWFSAVTEGMRATGATVGCSNPWGTPHEPRLKTEPDRDIAGRMPGWAWIVDGSKGHRADESMGFWWVDTDWDFRARQISGMVMIGGYAVPNVQPGFYTNVKPELGEIISRDREAFVAKWVTAPW